MIFEDKGLLEAFKVFHTMEQTCDNLDFSKGVLQAIGYKEFYKFYLFLKDLNEEGNIDQIMT